MTVGAPMNATEVTMPSFNLGKIFNGGPAEGSGQELIYIPSGLGDRQFLSAFEAFERPDFAKVR